MTKINQQKACKKTAKNRPEFEKASRVGGLGQKNKKLTHLNRRGRLF